jgi:hypothetical protein
VKLDIAGPMREHCVLIKTCNALMWPIGERNAVNPTTNHHKKRSAKGAELLIGKSENYEPEGIISSCHLAGKLESCGTESDFKRTLVPVSCPYKSFSYIPERIEDFVRDILPKMGLHNVVFQPEGNRNQIRSHIMPCSNFFMRLRLNAAVRGWQQRWEQDGKFNTTTWNDR